nr:MAG TPA: hypothetical protein [Caudoviricetes sp.]
MQTTSSVRGPLWKTSSPRPSSTFCLSGRRRSAAPQ